MEKDKPASTGAIDYGNLGYWDKRYAQKQGERFEWLQPYERLKPVIQACLPSGKDSTILNLGCGNSSIQESLYSDGYKQVTSNDISSIVIQQMKEAQQQKGMEGLRYDVMDVREMTYPDQSFDLIIDKSTIDSLMCSDHPYLNTTQMIEEGYRVLKAGGYYLTISYSGSRKEQFFREIVNFEVEEKVLKRTDPEGCQLTNYLYLCKKKAMDEPTAQQRTEFYNRLKVLEEKDYPPV